MKLEDLTDLERCFVDAVAAGEPFFVDETLPQDQWLPPDEDSEARDIHATVIEALVDGRFGASRITRQGIRLAGARIIGDLNLDYVTHSPPLMMIHCLFQGPISLTGATIELLTLKSSNLSGGLNASYATVNQSIFLRGVTATGLVDLTGAQIGGQLACEGAVLDGGDGAAFHGQGLTTKEDVFLRGVTATGLVDLTGAQIGGQLSCSDAVLDGGDGAAFHGQGLTTRADVFLRGVTATGQVDLNGARIGGQLDCEGAVLNGGDGTAFKGQRLTSKDSVFLRGMTATGRVDLSGAQIGGQLSCIGAVLDGGEGTCLFLQQAEVAALLLILSAGSKGRVYLIKATVGALVVRHDAWPKDVKVVAQDVCVASLPSYRTTAQEKWLSWLKKSVVWSPHLYQQIALRLKEAGHEDCAKAFYIAMRRRTRQEEHRLFLAGIPKRFRNTRLNAYFFDRLGEAFRRFFDAVLERTVGYGHRPLLAAWWMAGLVLLGMTVFQQASDLALMAPTRAVIFEDIPPAEKWREGYWACQQANPDARVELVLRTAAEDACLPADYPAFIPLFYSFDLAIPLLEMQPEKNWSVNGSAPWGWVFMLYYYIHIIVGTVLTGLFLAAVTGLVKKE